MSARRLPDRLTPSAQAVDPATLERHFSGGDGLLPLWIAEPYVDLAPGVTAALEARAQAGWFGYETRSPALADSFWAWMGQRHNWDGEGLRSIVSPSIGTSIGVLIEQFTEFGDGVILQPPVFTDFKPSVTSAERTVVRNPLRLTDAGYRMDLDDLELKAAAPTTTAMILCNPHNPVGRVWTDDDLSAVARICARHDVFVIADEIHADLILRPHSFTPFATAADDTGVRWAALHGPIKTFGMAGVCDTLVITDVDEVVRRFESKSSRLHLTRNNVFGLAAFDAAYGTGAPWLDDLLELVDTNAAKLRIGLPDQVRLMDLEGTYLAWLDFRSLGMDVPQLAQWLAAEARLALSPGHWFGREGAGFARITIAAPTDLIEDAIARLHRAVERLA
ncbi:MAG: aminotransferase class I/II-fold pyridoxal phosphate-dependent enzyme [Acidimicrobiales bacterium]|nr:aminotransferase class I/II-fold pyridoxal phosphate-dependent enzyme [Acidimicrobiales bacterium]